MLQHCDDLALHSNDPDQTRCESLRAALLNHVPDKITNREIPDKITNREILVTSERGQSLLAHSDSVYDRVLIDAPCSTDKHLLLSTDETAQVCKNVVFRDAVLNC
eukprot:COSAG06_NODE_729_length_12742_cov_15.795064_6_plen_106_part_00